MIQLSKSQVSKRMGGVVCYFSHYSQYEFFYTQEYDGYEIEVVFGGDIEQIWGHDVDKGSMTPTLNDMLESKEYAISIRRKSGKKMAKIFYQESTWC